MWDDVEPGWDSGSAYQESLTSLTVTDDIATATQAVDNSGTGSVWGFLQGTLGKVVDYSLQRDAAKTAQQLQLQRQTALSTQPLLASTANGLAVNPMVLVLGAGLVLAIVLAARGKG